MSKFIQTAYGNSKEILKFNNFTAMNVMVSDVGIKVNSNGKKIVPAGTIVGGATKPRYLNPDEPVVNKNTDELGAFAEGILLSDVDVTYGPEAAAMVIAGFIDLDKLPAAPVEKAKASLRLIEFLR